ncbi:polysaccharide biosynthesis protein [Litorivita pollutaquae]|uniref:Polysaccharide biosynthesis protein n=1 Tax=Litorivita pollutaquae TaxID=2200892 RepID=A0A2V4N8S1_9RHOB|nr:oligosaccharide flippase family protein [Litorivita pollutaquae]PYC46423.1 polysaccharide biosynthesis protein [Litorivita pollutaquae]
MSAPKPQKSLGRRAATAGGWNLIWVVGENALRLGSNLIMTRILLPEAFSLMMIVMTVLTALNLLTDIGIRTSITREPDGDDPYFMRVAWSVKLRRGVGIALLVLCCAVLLGLVAPHVARAGTVYADPRLPWLLALAALAPLLQGIESTSRELVNRQMRFARFVSSMLVSRALSIAVMIGCAQLSPTVWALLLGALSMNVMQTLASHVIYDGPRMKFLRDTEIEARLWTFGKFIIGASALQLLGLYSDRFFLGALMSTVAFGYFAVAMIWIDAGRMVVQRLGNFVGLATLAEVRRTAAHRLPKVFMRVQFAIDAICLLAFTGCITLGPAFLDLLYPERFAAVGEYLRFLGLVFLSMRFVPLGTLLMIDGQSKAMMINSGLRALGALVLIPAGYASFGVKGALIGSALAPLFGAAYLLVKVRPLVTRFSLILGWVWILGILLIAAIVARYMSLPTG